jgi:acetamidase/formamidase
MAAGSAIHISRDRFHLAWDPAIPPIEVVPSGTEVEFDLLDASGGQLTSTSTVADIATLDFGRVDQVNGPIAVEGAEPGDVLQVDLLEFEPADWGWTASIPGFGLLADDFTEPAYRVTAVPGAGNRAEFLPGIRLPVVPFCGELGVAPETGPRSTIPPDLHGGNMDTRHLTAGATLFLPVFHSGARFSIGDGHAAQGDGEVCGTAIETPMRALVRLSVRKDLSLSAPEFLTAGGPSAEVPVGRRYATDGIGPDLLSAARDAVRRMIDWLGREHGIAPIDAYMLCSVGVDLRISEIVDAPNFVVTAHCPLAMFD